MLSVEFKNFWQGFNTEDNIFKALILDSRELQHYSSKHKIRIIFFSVFAKHRRIGAITNSLEFAFEKIYSKFRRELLIGVHYSGELDFPGVGFDSYFGYRGKNTIYWPLWATYCSTKKRDFLTDRGKSIEMSRLCQPIAINTTDRQKKACTFISNLNNSQRLSICNSLHQLGSLDLFGTAFGRKVINKNVIAQQYMFEVCFENTDFPGYVTEKIIESWLNGCYPIYFGSDSYGYLNPSAFLDCKTHDPISIKEFIEKSYLNINKGIHLIPPILNRPFNLGVLESKILEILIKKTR